MSETVPVPGRGYLNCLFEASEGAPDVVQNLVRQAIHSRNTIDLMRYCEIVDKSLATNMSETLVKAAVIKMDHDIATYSAGTKTFENVLRHIAIMGVIAGAHLAKEKKL